MSAERRIRRAFNDLQSRVNASVSARDSLAELRNRGPARTWLLAPVAAAVVLLVGLGGFWVLRSVGNGQEVGGFPPGPVTSTTTDPEDDACPEWPPTTLAPEAPGDTTTTVIEEKPGDGTAPGDVPCPDVPPETTIPPDTTIPPTIVPESTTTSIVNADCSASGYWDLLEDQEGLPPAVADMRLSIMDGAASCDFEQLARLPSHGGDLPFTYSFGDDGDPATFWREYEDNDVPVLAHLLSVLDMSYAVVETQLETDVYTEIYVWPAAFAYDNWADVPDEAKQELLAIYEDFEQFELFGAYAGWRVGITTDGDWIFFVAGD